MNPRSFRLSSEVLTQSQEFLAKRGLSYESTAHRQALAVSIKKLSDHFIQNPEAATPWDKDWAQEAYAAYYLPLNEVRNRAVVEEGLRHGFFEGLEFVIDFGSGPGTADFALAAKVPELKSYWLIDRSEFARNLFSQPHWETLSTLTKLPSPGEQTLFVASYSLTETELPRWAWDCEAMMLLEPSTQEDGRRLMKLRAELIERGFSIWAPCTHQQACPLLTHSPRDWCHDRVHLDRSEDWEKLEQLLPFRNQTLTFSYLLARRKTAPVQAATRARVVGDDLPEKGKTRQMICRSSEREFAAWMHRNGEPRPWSRGELVEIPVDAPKKSNEIRL